MNTDLNELLKNAKTHEEAKQIVDSYKCELSDDELDNVSGGYPSGNNARQAQMDPTAQQIHKILC